MATQPADRAKIEFVSARWRREATKTERAIRLFWRTRLALVGLVIVALVAAMALAAPLIAPHDPVQQNLMRVVRPPVWEARGSAEYLLGTDQYGRDILSRIIYGARATLISASAAALSAALLGTVLGLAAGYYGRYVDTLVMRLVDLQLGFPLILLAIVLVAVLGASLQNLVIALAVTGWMIYARVVRGVVLSLKEREFIVAARAVGAGNARIMFRHILPNSLTPVIVIVTLEMARMVLMESSLSYLGLGVPPPTPTWGRMLAEGRDYMIVAYWMAISPGLAIMLTVMGINFLGDGLRDALDPRLRTQQ